MLETSPAQTRVTLDRVRHFAWGACAPSEREEVPMPIVGGLDIHRKQLTFDYPGTVTGEVKRGQVVPASAQGAEKTQAATIASRPGRCTAMHAHYDSSEVADFPTQRPRNRSVAVWRFGIGDVVTPGSAQGRPVGRTPQCPVHSDLVPFPMPETLRRHPTSENSSAGNRECHSQAAASAGKCAQPTVAGGGGIGRLPEPSGLATAGLSAATASASHWAARGRLHG